MHVELLSSIPISGSIRERHFNASPGRNAWVRFDDGTSEPWVGVFGLPSDEYDYTSWSSDFRGAAVAPFGDDDGQTALVIAGTHGYIVDAVRGVVLRETSVLTYPDVYTLASPPARGFVLVADPHTIYAVYRDRDAPITREGRRPDNYTYRWDSEPPPGTLSDFGGIVFDEPGLTEISGNALQDDGWCEFRLRYDTLVVNLGKDVRGHFETAVQGHMI